MILTILVVPILFLGLALVLDRIERVVINPIQQEVQITRLLEAADPDEIERSATEMFQQILREFPAADSSPRLQQSESRPQFSSPHADILK